MATSMAADAIGMLHQAIALSLMFDFGRLQKKSTRLQTIIDLLDKYNNKFCTQTFTEEEKAICKEFDNLLVEWLSRREKK